MSRPNFQLGDRAMNLTISSPVWVKKPAGRGSVRTCYIEGLENSYSEPRAAPVDAGIAELIVALNRAGYTTEWCCSGLPEDHRQTSQTNPYIGFASRVPKIPLTWPLFWEDSYHIRADYEGSADELRAAWAALLESLSTSQK